VKNRRATTESLHYVVLDGIYLNRNGVVVFNEVAALLSTS
jgi:hypothetical protein